jgi:prepilin-type processing-associated H-X9-DG protein
MVTSTIPEDVVAHHPLSSAKEYVMFKRVVVLVGSVLLVGLVCLAFDLVGANRASAEVNGEQGKAGEGAAAGSQSYLSAMQRRSAEMLIRYGELVAAYAADHGGKYPTDNVRDVGPYKTPKDRRGDRPMLSFIQRSVGYLAAGETRKDLPKTAAVAYDTKLLPMTDGTNVLFADGHVDFVKDGRLKALGIEPGQKITMAKRNKAYEVTLPASWKPYVSAGKLTVVGAPFYGVRSKGFAVKPHVRIRWSWRNLTSEPVVVRIQYKSWRTSRLGGHPGRSQVYRLAPNGYRAIDDIQPVATATEPAEFYVWTEGLSHNGQKVDTPRRHHLVTTDPLLPGKLPPSRAGSNKSKTAQFVVKESRLRYSASQGNLLELDVSNRTDAELPPLLVYAAACDPGVPDPHFVETTKRIAARGQSVVRLPYSVPTSGPNPLLVFTVYEPPRGSLPVDYNDYTLLYWGWIDLRQAAEQGLAKVPAYVPLEERIKLTAKKRSKHFLFRFRPDCYAQRNIDTAIEQREQAYRRLSRVLGMELPEMVTVDLYPDGQAKGLGSGTYYTPANTVTDTHIAEVYNSSYQCDIYHELAHIFSYRFGDTGPAAPGLIENFAEYFEHQNMNLDDKRQAVRRQLGEGKLRPLNDLLLSGGTCKEYLLLIDFLLKRDLEKFKAFYVRVTHAKGAADLEIAFRETYSTGLKDLEKQWHESLAAADTTSTPKKTGDGGAETPEQAVLKAFKKLQAAARDRDLETVSTLIAKNMRSQGQSGFDDKFREVFINLRPVAVTAVKIPRIGNVLAVHVEYNQQAWGGFAFIKEDGQWKLCEGKRK